ncbi:MAG TPA: hypothetical protein VM285_04745 [Polyangia bacterium]|nr:hypothetical protein [Polyangia bacterium]
MYPVGAGRDAKAVLLAHIEETRDIPAWWISEALAKLVRDPGREFAPSIGAIRGAAMRAIKDDRINRACEAGAPKPVYPHGEPALNESRELGFAWANEVQRRALASGLETRLIKMREPDKQTDDLEGMP